MSYKQAGLFAFTAILASVMAIFATIAALDLATPQPVQAAPESKELKIAVVNLEHVARSSRKFAACKREWDAASRHLAAWRAQRTERYENTRKMLAKEMAQNPNDSHLELRAELQAMEQLLEAAKEEHEEYLAALLAGFQEIVLEDVYVNLKRYVRQQGYNLVLQDYTLDASDADFFSGSGYAESLLSKPVLDAPYALEGDPHVTDITAIMVKFMSGDGVPEKEND